MPTLQNEQWQKEFKVKRLRKRNKKMSITISRRLWNLLTSNGIELNKEG